MRGSRASSDRERLYWLSVEFSFTPGFSPVTRMREIQGTVLTVSHSNGLEKPLKTVRYCAKSLFTGLKPGEIESVTSPKRTCTCTPLFWTVWPLIGIIRSFSKTGCSSQGGAEGISTRAGRLYASRCRLAKLPAINHQKGPSRKWNCADLSSFAGSLSAPFLLKHL